MSEEEFLSPDREYKFMICFKTRDCFLTVEKVIEFIKFRLNLKHACYLTRIYLLEDSGHPDPITLLKEGNCHEKCNAA